MAFKWMQSNSNVTVTFAGPSSKKKEDVDVIITATNFKAGLRGVPPVCEVCISFPGFLRSFSYILLFRVHYMHLLSQHNQNGSLSLAQQ